MKKKVILSVLLLVCCVSSLVLLTTAWIRRTWAPEFKEDEITVKTAGSLVINLVDNQTPLNEITLNELFGTGEFYLAQVSNCSGESEDFFKIDYGDGQEGMEKVVHLDLQDSSDYTQLGKTNGYIEGTFFLAGVGGTTGTSKYIYLDSTSCLESLNTGGVDVSNAIRISITIHGTSQEAAQTIIIKKGAYSHTGISNIKNPSGGYMYNGSYLYSGQDPVTQEWIVNGALPSTTDETTSFGNPRKLYHFEDLDGGIDPNDPDVFDVNKTIFMMAASESRQITVRVWLEGFDPACSDLIAGHKIKLRLVFKAHDIENDNTSSQGDSGNTSGDQGGTQSGDQGGENTAP